jgi:hypothetical protein
MAGFLAVTAGATLPGIGDDLDAIYRSLSKTVHGAATRSQGSGQSPTRL